MNRYLILMCAALFPLNSNASWYGGINLGVNSVDIKKELLYPIDDLLPATATYRTNYTNGHGQISLGYEFQLNDKIGTAIETNADAFVGQSKHRINNWFITDNALAEERLEYGASVFLLPSYQFNSHTKFFIGPGISASKFAIKSGYTAGNIGVTGSFNKWLTGGSLKTGMSTQISEHIEATLSYQYTVYNSVTWEHVEPLSEESLRGQYRPYVNTAMIGIKIKLPESKNLGK
ncbi:outer membrane beta-barrel protein [uncultured Legionella sp.]|uniref:outer membrane beta-barrel protein n=1 Tax=uncultured Legionella sp. TaxID=210934 RepID=UPI002608A0A9|nr:outer membrane beta-barrel protein [uncultured Legionella sp.]